MDNRLSKHQYYLNIAEEVSKRCTCLSVQIGCLIVNNDQIIATGYVGAPRKTKDCLELGFCLRRQMNIPSGTQYEMCRSVHAEQNALINAARAGVSVLGGEMYLFSRKIYEGEDKLIKAFPCYICKKIILNAGIERIIGNDENGDIVEYGVSDWQKEWAENDMLGEQVKYNANYKLPNEE